MQVKIARSNMLFNNYKFSKNVNLNKETQEQNYSNDYSTSAPIVKNYAIASQKISFGISNVSVQKDLDTFNVVLRFSDSNKNAVRAEIDTKVKSPLSSTKSQELVLESKKDNFDNYFTFHIPILDRTRNKLSPRIEITKVTFFDAQDNKIEVKEVLPKGMKEINAKELFNLDAYKEVSINNNKLVGAKFNNISTGKAQGALTYFDSYDDLKNYHKQEPVIAYLDSKELPKFLKDIQTNENFFLPKYVKGLICEDNEKSSFLANSMALDVLGHLVSRLRNKQVVTIADKNIMEKIDTISSPFVQLEAAPSVIKLSPINKVSMYNPVKVNIPKPDFDVHNLVVPEDKDNFTLNKVGLKAYNLGKLSRLATQKNSNIPGFNVPNFIVLPAGVLADIKNNPINEEVYGADPAFNKGKKAYIGEYHQKVKELKGYIKTGDNESVRTTLNELKTIIEEKFIIPDKIQNKIYERTQSKLGNLPDSPTNKIYKYGEDDNTLPLNAQDRYKNCLIVRSSFTGEDSTDLPTQGLYDSIAGIRTKEELMSSIRKVWSSKWKELPFWSRVENNIKHNEIQPNIIIQEVKPVDYTFTIYTADTINHDKNKILIQLSQGVDCGFTSSPYIFEYDKQTKDVSRISLATKGRAKDISKVLMGDEERKRYNLVDYSKDPLNMDKTKYTAVITDIAKIAEFIEDNFDNKPQDIEGGLSFVKKKGVVQPEISIWQTRDIIMN